MTRAVKQLEGELGGDLFRRERNLSHLTEFGHRMLPLLQQCYDSAASAKALAGSLKVGAPTPLSIALSTSVTIRLLVPFIAELTRSFPGTELRFMRGMGPEVAQFLKKGDADAAIAGPLGESWDRLEAWPLFTEPYRLVVGEAHPYAKRDSVRPEEIAKERVLTRTHCERLHEITSFLKGNQNEAAPSHRVASEYDLHTLLKANLGVGIAPVSAARSDNVKLVRITGLDLTRTVHVYAVAGRERSPVAATLIKMLRAADWSAYETVAAPVTSAKI